MSSEKINPVEIACALPPGCVTGSLARISGCGESSTPLQETPSRRAMIPNVPQWLFRAGAKPAPVPPSASEQTAAAPVVDAIRLLLSVASSLGGDAVSGSFASRQQAQRPRHIHAPLAVVRISSGLTEVVGRLENPGPDQRGNAVTQLRYQQRREPRDVRRGEARAPAVGNGQTGQAIRATSGLRRGGRARQPDVDDGRRAGTCGRGDAHCRAAERGVPGRCVHVLPRPVDAGGAGRPGSGHADGVGGLARQPEEIAVVIEVGPVIEGDGHQQRALPECVVYRPLEGRDRTGPLALIELAAIADVDHVGALVRGVHDAAEEAAGGARPGRVVDLHGEQCDVSVDSGQEVRITRDDGRHEGAVTVEVAEWEDRKSTRLNSSHSQISYAVFCLKKKKKKIKNNISRINKDKKLTDTQNYIQLR